MTKKHRPYKSLSSLRPRVAMLEPSSRVKVLPRIKPTAVVRANSRERARQRRQVINRDGPLCRSCSTDIRVVASAHMDHVIALKDGGVDDISNMQLLCEECHKLKSAAEATARAARGDAPVEQQPKPRKDYKVW
jgi:5-methylcytosine-specific restriction endonuclease McrA